MHNMHWCVAASAVTLWLAAPLHGQDHILGGRDLREYVQQVLDGNGGYEATRLRVSAAEERIAPAGALPDPELTFGLMAVPTPSFDFTAEPMTRLPVGIRQHFPFPGKQAAAAEVARADSAAAGAALGAAEARLVAGAAVVYYELAYAATAVRVWRSRVRLADQTITVTQTRYETGAIPQVDLLRARLRRAELNEVGLGLEAAVAQVRARADALRGGARDPITPLLLVTEDGRSAFDVLLDTLIIERLLSQLREQGPELRVAEAAATRSERNARVFAIARRPDFTVALESGIRFGGREPFTTALIGISIPLWSARKQSPASRAARYEAEAAREDYRRLLDDLTGELHDRFAELSALQRRIGQTADEIVPLAAAASASALQRYRVGAVEFTTVLDTQDDIFDAQLRLARLIADYGTARAQLASLVGEEWYR